VFTAVNHSTYALVVDDHPLVGRGIAEYLKTQRLLDDVLVVSTLDEAQVLFNQSGPPVVLLVDFWLHEGATDKFVALVRNRWPSTKVLVMSGDDNPAILTKVRGSGAHGFLHKKHPPSAFSDAITALLHGKQWYTPQEPEQSVHPSSRNVSVSAGELGLTPRQGQILGMLLQAFPNRRIADALSVSEHTVKEHVTAILNKLSVGNRVELITKLRGVILTDSGLE
jgi:DNA-binding NarL/FixJ family response regulator